MTQDTGHLVIRESTGNERRRRTTRTAYVSGMDESAPQRSGGRALEDAFSFGVVVTISIRRAREEDAESIVELLNPIIRAGTYTVMDEEVSVDEQIAFFRSFPERGIYNVAVCETSEKVVGMQDVVPLSSATRAFKHVGEISTFVSLASHRSGVGRRLSQATFRKAGELGFSKICAMIRADNPQAVAFYRSQGFEILGTAKKHAFVRGRHIDEILMERFID